MVDPRDMARLRETGPFCRKCGETIREHRQHYEESRRLIVVTGRCRCGSFETKYPDPRPPEESIDYENLYPEYRR
jgi:hypothetical protein